MGRAFALDFGAILMMGDAQRVDNALLSELLPDINSIVMAARRDAEEE